MGEKKGRHLEARVAHLHICCHLLQVLHFLHEFYEMVAYILNTLIFAIAGLKMGTFLSDLNLSLLLPSGLITPTMLIGIFAMLVARGVVLMLFFPLLKQLGTSCSWHSRLTLPVSLASELSVTVSPTEPVTQHLTEVGPGGAGGGIGRL